VFTIAWAESFLKVILHILSKNDAGSSSSNEHFKVILYDYATYNYEFRLHVFCTKSTQSSYTEDMYMGKALYFV